MTDAEVMLWHKLRDRRMLSVKFRRQAPIGPYIADFLCVQHRLVIQADGAQHADSAHDLKRDRWPMQKGYRTLRFWNDDILRRTDEVMATIAAACGLEW